jgi:hypothetical protein
MMTPSLRGLDIRCAFARALILEQIYGERAEIVQEAFHDVHDAAIILGSQEFEVGIDTPPILFASSRLLVNAWECGYAMGMEFSYWSSRFEDDGNDDY